MGWRDDLADRVRLVNDGLNHEAARAATFEGASFPIVDEARSIDFANLARLTGCVNAGEFCGAAPETLLFVGADADRIGPADFPAWRRTLNFAYRPGQPWNRFLTNEGRMKEFRDSQNNPMYPLVDLDELATSPSETGRPSPAPDSAGTR